MKSVVTLSPASTPLASVYMACVEEDEAFTRSQIECLLGLPEVGIKINFFAFQITWLWLFC